MHPARRRLAFLSAAIAVIAAVLAVLVPLASAAAASASETRVGAHHPGVILTVGASRSVCPVQCRGQACSQPGFVAGACVAAEEQASAIRAYRSGQSASSGGAISLEQARAVAERNGIDMRMFDLQYEAGAKAGDYAFTSQTGSGAIYRTASGRFLMTLTDSGLASEEDAVNSIAHELNHVREIMANGPGYFIDSEAPAIQAGNTAEQFFR